MVPATSAALPNTVPGVCRMLPGVTFEKSGPALPELPRGPAKVATPATPPFSSSPLRGITVTSVLLRSVLLRGGEDAGSFWRMLALRVNMCWAWRVAW